MSRLPSADSQVAAVTAARSGRYGRRWAAGACGLVTLAYIANAAWNVTVLVHHHNNALGKWHYLLAALTLPDWLVEMNVPAWLDGISAIAFALVLAGDLWMFKGLMNSSRPADLAPEPSDRAPGHALRETPSRLPKRALLQLPDTAETPSTMAPPMPSSVSAQVGADSARPVTSHPFVPRIFISHSGKDKAFGERLAADLRDVFGSAAVWFDATRSAEDDYETGLAGGDPFPSAIIYHLYSSNVFVVILSPDAVRSNWVLYEIDQAVKRYLSSRRHVAVLLPVMYRRVDLPQMLSIFQYIPMPSPDGPEHKVEYHDALDQVVAQIRSGETRRQEREGSPPYDDDRLPVPDPFVGREDDLGRLMDRLRRGGATAVTAVRGIGGIGKTGLAAKAMSQAHAEGLFPDGIAVILCAGRRDATGVLRDALARFDARRRQPEAEDDVGLAEAARGLLVGKRALVVLDNVEPELDVAAVVVPLRAAGAVLLLTARQQVPRAVVGPDGNLELGLLSEFEALDLFAHELGRASALELTHDERAAATRIVVVLGRHTLAVKLAGAYAGDVGRDLGGLTRELEDPGRALALPEGEAPDGVKRVFATSYEALPDAARRLFAALAAFATPELGRLAALAIAGALRLEKPVGALELLVRRGLADAAVAEALPAEADRERLRLHPLMRAFAATELARWPSSSREVAALAVAEYYADYAASATTEGAGRAADEANITGALEWAHEQGRDELVAELCAGMQQYWRDRSKTAASLLYLRWGIAVAEAIAARTHDRADRLRAAGLNFSYGVTLKFMGRLDAAADIFAAGLEVCKELQDRRGEAQILTELGWIAQRRDELDEAEHYYRLSYGIQREMGGDRKSEGWALYWLGDVERFRENWDTARRYLLESLAIFREVRDRRGESHSLTSLANVAIGQDNLPEAETYARSALDIAREVQYRWGEGFALSALGKLARERGELIQADSYHQQSLAIDREVQSQWDVAIALSALGSLARTRGRLEEAEVYYEQSLAAYAQLGQVSASSQSGQLVNLADLAIERGRWEDAESSLRQALTLDREAKNRKREFGTVLELARLRLREGQVEAAKGHVLEARLIEQELRDRPDAHVRLTALGQLEQDLGHVEEAEVYYQQALSLVHQAGDRRREWWPVTCLGRLALARQQFEEAETYFRQALTISREVRQSYIAASCVDLARLGRRRGDVDAAEELLGEALAIGQGRKDRGWESAILGEFGALEQARSQFDKAESYYQQALAINEEVGSLSGVHLYLIKLGQLYKIRQNLARAEVYFQRALDLSREIRHSRLERSCLTELGLLELARRRFDEAETYFREALAISRRLKDRSAIAVSLIALAGLVTARGDLNEADGYLQDALDLARLLGDRGGQRFLLRELGELAIRQSRLDDAADYLQQALAVDREMQDRRAEVADLNKLGGIQQGRGRPDEAKACLEQALAISQEIKDPGRERRELIELGRLAMDRQQYDEALAYLGRALAIAEGLEDRFAQTELLLLLFQLQLERERQDDGTRME